MWADLMINNQLTATLDTTFRQDPAQGPINGDQSFWIFPPYPFEPYFSRNARHPVSPYTFTFQLFIPGAA